jgi:hypothetical protein
MGDIQRRMQIRRALSNSLPGQSFSVVLGFVSWNLDETTRRLCAAGYGSVTEQETWPPEFFSGPLRRANSRGMSLMNVSPSYLRRESEMTCGRHWRTWRNISSFARIRACGATGWTDGATHSAVDAPDSMSSCELTVCDRVSGPTVPGSPG